MVQVSSESSMTNNGKCETHKKELIYLLQKKKLKTRGKPLKSHSKHISESFTDQLRMTVHVG